MKIPSGTAVGGEGGVAGEGKLSSVPKFYSWVGVLGGGAPTLLHTL